MLIHSSSNIPFPCVADLRSAENPNIELSGASPSTVNQLSLVSAEVMMPPRAASMDTQVPYNGYGFETMPFTFFSVPQTWNSSGPVTSTFMMGSRICQTPSSKQSSMANCAAW